MKVNSPVLFEPGLTAGVLCVLICGRRAPIPGERVSSDRGVPPRLYEAELPAVAALEFVVTPGDDRSALARPAALREGQGERLCREDMYSRLLFSALCRREGATAYKAPAAASHVGLRAGSQRAVAAISLLER